MMKKYTTSASIILLIQLLSTPSVADKGVQIWGNKQGSNLGLEFYWDNQKKHQTAQNNTMMGNQCWSQITGVTDEKFNIFVSNNGETIKEMTAKVDPTFGDTVMTWNENMTAPERQMGNIWPTTGSSTYQNSMWLSNNSVVVNYGMYSAGPKDSTPIQGHDQAYAYVTPNMQSWMGNTRNNSTTNWDNATLQKLVLPGAHDAGMWTLAPGINTAANLKNYLNAIIGWLSFIPGISLILDLVEQDVFYAIQNTSLTHKDPTSVALKSGIRYFDYRPAQILGNIPGFGNTDYYHVHNFIPGYNFASFLDDVGSFLSASGNEHEIVIVNVKDSGILGTSGTKSSSSTLLFSPLYADSSDLSSAQSWITNSLGNKYPNISPLFTNDFSSIATKTLGSLYGANNRLIFYFGTGYNDSYPTTNPQQYYGTFQPGNVKTALENIYPTCQSDTTNYTVFQLQDTALDYLVSNLSKSSGEEYAIGLYSNGSITLSTKGMFDNTTYPWVMNNLGGCSSMAVMLNDYAGNLLAYNAAQLTNHRINSASIAAPGPQSCDPSQLDQ